MQRGFTNQHERASSLGNMAFTSTKIASSLSRLRSRDPTILM